MNSRLLAILIILPIWLTLVILFRKHRQWLLYYMAGAFGLALMLVFGAELIGLDQLIVNIASFHVSLIAEKIFHLNAELLSGGRFQVFLPGGGSSILKLGIECSAVLESSILVGLIAFYPLFDVDQKILRILFGLAVTYVLNITRLLIIVCMAYKFGPDYIFVAHAFVGRAFFFIFELMLYWWIMTKPSVKTVGDALNLHIPLSKVAKVGASLRRSNSMIQVIFIALVLGFSGYSFMRYPDSSKIFANLTPQKRPIIYQEETTAEAPKSSAIPETVAGTSTSAKNGQPSLNQEIALELDADEKKTIGLSAFKEETLLIGVSEGKGEIASRLTVNGKRIDFVTVQPWAYLKENAIFEPLTVKSGDVIELKFQNLSDKKSNYLINILSKENELKACSLEESFGKKVAPASTPAPTVSNTPKSVAGVAAATSINQEMKFTLAAKTSSSFKFNITKEEKVSIQISDGNMAFAGKVLINGKEIDIINSTPGYSTGSAFILPVLVHSGDSLEIILQNTTTSASDFLLKVYPVERSE